MKHSEPKSFDSEFYIAQTSDGIDNEYLYFMLKRNKIFGACMDVFDIEPYYGKFTKLENVILTPHIGSYSKEIRFKMEAESLTKILRTKLITLWLKMSQEI